MASTDEVTREAVDIVVKYFNSIAKIPKAFRLESASPVTGLRKVSGVPTMTIQIQWSANEHGSA